MDAGNGTGTLIGCAGWSLSRAVASHFPGEGSHLERYARVLPAVEINSAFYRPHKPATYARWRDSVPAAFRFSVKMPKEISHLRRLRDCGQPLENFLSEVAGLGDKLGCLLLQLPPSLAFDPPAAQAFLLRLRAATGVDVVCEPRHASWFGEEAAALLAECRIAYVEADPSPHALPASPTGPVYLRLHGTPRIYYSDYPEDVIDTLAARLSALREAGRTAWCVFDNTAEGAAVPNALSLLAKLAARCPPARP
ncbi:DUF72 domain-containing protein [Noviherbaspirillum aridicola]|uniref:DUF72 domain-containing protein n=1 Tax=Noviherbaspirillum aridicola TaxID=2849687 RepID=A0ABQ4Q1X8_9BURK|nr:DUF72 domain-containing protein [Noviherbaspirillum aridicola]GIZ50815.1 hypothetical protein NCCP691_08290 [Noviherbaspirillum aridicola]